MLNRFWKILFATAGLTASFSPANAQREVLYAQYFTNPLTINPAYTGVRESLTMTAVFRRKWLGVQGFPVTQSLGMDGEVGNSGIGLGLQALNDRMSPYSNTGIYGSVAYHIRLASGAKLSFGGSGGINVLPVFDPATSVGLNKALPSVGVGAHYEGNTLWLGISKPELIDRPLRLTGTNAALQYNRPLFIQAGAKLPASEGVMLMPSLLLTQQQSLPLGVDLNLKSWFMQKVALGVSVRLNNASLIARQSYVLALAEYQLANTIRVGYNYSSRTAENPFFPQRSVHELVFRYTPSPMLFQYR
ncbi:PorP/SprF family type IX secretion system membrane protein [Tellurirhabdus rosea]|uniref:PorP/SprF family type IX secretion system membrane protein n=1 Tax=Tellurirhabdus rosea TaxID=2674997 RepID=UPI002253959D|nr:PorP/SprF family type IX secretion system membrane protein [Tellurirhabdus rosea]